MSTETNESLATYIKLCGVAIIVLFVVVFNSVEY